MVLIGFRTDPITKVKLPPPLPPAPKHIPLNPTIPIHPQPQSPFLSLLPAEIRNAIYTHLFSASTTPRQTPPSTAHPLAILRTCRLINLEASGLAYSLVTFTITSCTYHILSRRTCILCSDLKNNISRLAMYDKDHINSTVKFATAVANSVVLFPGLRIIESRVCVNGTGLVEAGRAWLRQVAEMVVGGRVVAWQKGQKWEVEWPGLVAGCDGVGEESVEQQIGESAVDDEGLEDSFKVALVQETGRRVVVRASYGWMDGVERVRAREKMLKLEEAVGEEAMRLPVVVCNSGAGIMWYGCEEWWEERRAKGSWWGRVR